MGWRSKIDHVVSSLDRFLEATGLAAAVRLREFHTAALKAAINGDRIRIHRAVPDDGLLPKIRLEVDDAWSRGHHSIGIFGHSNRSVADLSASLFAVGMDDVLIGLPEAHGEALAAMEVACLFGAGHVDFGQLRLRLAVFLTASVRGNAVPELAVGLKGSSVLPAWLRGSAGSSQSPAESSVHSRG